MIKVHIIPIIEDNYAYAIEGGGEVVVVDPGEAEGVIQYLEQHSLTPTQIWNTHHHWDHVNGNKGVSKHYGGLPVFNTDNPPRAIGNEPLEIIATPGHTLDHICFYFPESAAIFSADTLFSMGCGRLFEGTPEQMWESLCTLAALPDDTEVYCGHEYTAANAAFCLRIEPDNKALQRRTDEVKALRAEGQPTIPSTIGQEKETNVFMRAGTAARFAELRALKDQG